MSPLILHSKFEHCLEHMSMGNKKRIKLQLYKFFDNAGERKTE